MVLCQRPDNHLHPALSVVERVAAVIQYWLYQFLSHMNASRRHRDQRERARHSLE